MGRVLRYSDDGGEIMVRGKLAPKIGEQALDEEGKVIGKVSDVFGPVNRPYIAIRLAQRYEDVGPALKDKEVVVKGERKP